MKTTSFFRCKSHNKHYVKLILLLNFFALIEKVRCGEYRFQDIKLPKYRAKGSLFNLKIPRQSVIIHNGYLSVLMSNAFMSIFDRERIKIKVPEHIPVKKIKEVRIIPILNGQKFKIQYVYEVEPESLSLNQYESLAIDIGLDNLATFISTLETSFIMDGQRIKSINRLWNKRRAELQSKLQQGQSTSKLIRRLTLKRNNRVNDCIKKTARYIVKHCIEHNIGTIVYGYNLDFKRGINLGSKTN